MYIEGNTLTYKDHTTFKTFTIRCLGPDMGVGERFPVFARTQWWVVRLYSVFSIYSAFQISAEVDTELVIIITISIIQTEFYNKIQIIASL
jgi:hypothetical protein